jgi:hypothetical protein
MNKRLEPQEMLKLARLGRSRVGRAELIRYLEGEELSRREAVKARCYFCYITEMGEAEECEQRTCPLFPYSQFQRRDWSKATTLPPDMNLPTPTIVRCGSTESTTR